MTPMQPRKESKGNGSARIGESRGMTMAIKLMQKGNRHVMKEGRKERVVSASTEYIDY